ncbi:MAG: Rrf2 family transcriptional regulator [Treponema sp.]|nr:Rrf2 family transcriptional regulator [Treponema sp.]
MLKISTRGQYALMTMEILAEQGDNAYVPMKKISHKQNLSVKYLEQILIQLSKAGLVEGMRGNNGGYRIIKKPSEYTAGEILRAMEGDLSPRGNTDTKAVKSSGNEEFWKDFDSAVNTFVDSISLEQILEKSRENTGYMFYI